MIWYNTMYRQDGTGSPPAEREVACVKLDPEVRSENRTMAIGCFACTALMAVGFLIARRMDLSVVFGLIIGFALSAGNFFLMSLGITKALMTGDEFEAKKKMRASYLVRTVVMIGVMALSLWLACIHWLPVLASVFYPRIVIAARSGHEWIDHRRHPEKYRDEEIPASDGAEEEEPEEEKPDEFEKFVGHFSKGPVPGEEKKKD